MIQLTRILSDAKVAKQTHIFHCSATAAAAVMLPLRQVIHEHCDGKLVLVLCINNSNQCFMLEFEDFQKISYSQMAGPIPLNSLSISTNLF